MLSSIQSAGVGFASGVIGRRVGISVIDRIAKVLPKSTPLAVDILARGLPALTVSMGVIAGVEEVYQRCTKGASRFTSTELIAEHHAYDNGALLGLVMLTIADATTVGRFLAERTIVALSRVQGVPVVEGAVKAVAQFLLAGQSPKV